MKFSRRIGAQSEAETRAAGADLAQRLEAGDVVLLHGELGAGKTTFVRGLLQALGYAEPVRSPTFGLIQVFETEPPVMHADLYRLESPRGIGLEDYLATHVCLIEWPDRAAGLWTESSSWNVRLHFAGEGRVIEIESPTG